MNAESLCQRANSVFQHHPRELMLMVNGHLAGSQSVHGGKAEQSISLNPAEPIEFTEVFSEQGVRLLLLVLDKGPTASIVQEQSISLSDGRSLCMEVSFEDRWPELRVRYSDPQYDTPPCCPAASAQVALKENGSAFVPGPSEPAQSWALVSRIRWPARALALGVLAVLLIAMGITVMQQVVPPVTAAVLLDRAGVAEARLASVPDKVLHRSYVLEERTRSTGRVSRRRIETWQSACPGCKARRGYNEKDQLLAGEWTQADGTVKVLSLEEQRPDKPLFAAANIWRLSLSAGDFAKITGSTSLPVTATSESYEIHYASTQEAADVMVMEAKLTVRRSDYWPIRQDLVVKENGEVRDYSLVETQVEQPVLAAIPMAVFQPDPALLGTLPSEAVVIASPEVVRATPELEIELLSLLEDAGADLGEQLTVERIPEGKVRLEGIVETSERLDSILRVLSPVLRSRAVQLDVTTASQAIAKQGKVPARSQTVRADEVAPADNKVPLDSELRTYFTKIIPAGELDTEISRFANRVFSEERVALQHAWAINRLIDRFTPDELARMDQKGRAKWLVMISRHASEFEQHTGAVRSAIQPIFFPEVPPSNGGSGGVIRTDAELATAAKRLFKLGLANYEVVRAGFAVSTDASLAPQIKTTQFWQSMSEAQKCAHEIQQATSALAPSRN